MFSPGPDPKVIEALNQQIIIARQESKSAKYFAVWVLIVSGLSLIPDYKNMICKSVSKNREHISTQL